jgi:hypothetical protein
MAKNRRKARGHFPARAGKFCSWSSAKPGLHVSPVTEHKRNGTKESKAQVSPMIRLWKYPEASRTETLSDS